MMEDLFFHVEQQIPRHGKSNINTCDFVTTAGLNIPQATLTGKTAVTRVRASGRERDIHIRYEKFVDMKYDLYTIPAILLRILRPKGRKFSY